MVLIETLDSQRPDVKWIGASQPVSDCTPPHLAGKNVAYYKKCIFGPLSLSVGDCVLVLNADAAEPDSIAGCDIAKILHLYELREMCDKDPYRAVVQWYSRPQRIPHKVFDNDEICVDFDTEIIEEHRPYHPDISLETVYRKCVVVTGHPADSVEALLKSKHRAGPMFACRYKFIKVKKHYRLVPLQFSEEPLVEEPNTRPAGLRQRLKSLSEDTPNKASSVRPSSTQKPKRASLVENKRRRASVASSSSIEFLDMNYFGNENKVSPIKIVGGRSVIRLSAKKRTTNEDLKELTRGKQTVASPLAEYNINLTPTSRVSAARRNLNLSLENGADTTADSDCLNYSIVKNTDSELANNDIKIKLRLSERRRSTRLASLEEDPLNVERPNTQVRRKRIAVTENVTPSIKDIYHTPSKKNRGSGEVAESTPSTRCKSILKSASCRLAEGTPKRSIQLSNIVEKRIFEDDEIISTPKRGRPKSKDADFELKNSTQKTPTRGRRSSTKAQLESPNTKKTLTPSQKLKLLRSGDISPNIDKRSSNAGAPQEKSDLQLAREQLHVSVVPQSLPCREKEFDNIYTFLEGKIQDQCGGCMYVSGVPGTGKTATVTGVIRTLQRKVATDDLPPFEFLEINGMRLTEPRQAYVQIYKQLTGKTVSWEHAHLLLEKRFTTPAPRRVTTVLLVDELDILCNRRQDVVYNLLDWPTKSAARLVVVTIANTMDLPERLLMGKVTSRLGLTRLTFQPYTHRQLQEIVTGRLSGSEAFKSDAIQLVARKVAAVSGDARRALDICRRATEIADTSLASKSTDALQQCVTMLHVQQALAEMIASAKVQSIKNCSRIEQIFLQAVVAEVTRTGVEETTFLGVYSQIETIAAFMGVVLPGPGRALRICSKLGAERLLICEHSRTDIFQKILLNVSADDIHYALRVHA